MCIRDSPSMSQEPHVQTSPNFLCILPVAVAWSSSGGITIHHVLPVFWMTSCIPIMFPVVAWQYNSSLPAMWLRPNTPAGLELVAFCPGWQQVPVLDESVIQGVPGRVLHCCLWSASIYITARMLASQAEAIVRTRKTWPQATKRRKATKRRNLT